MKIVSKPNNVVLVLGLTWLATGCGGTKQLPIFPGPPVDIESVTPLGVITPESTSGRLNNLQLIDDNLYATTSGVSGCSVFVNGVELHLPSLPSGGTPSLLFIAGGKAYGTAILGVNDVKYFRWNLKGNTVEYLTDQPVAVSPNGRYVGFAPGSNLVTQPAQILDTVTGKTVTLDQPVWPLAVADDGSGAATVFNISRSLNRFLPNGVVDVNSIASGTVRTAYPGGILLGSANFNGRARPVVWKSGSTMYSILSMPALAIAGTATCMSKTGSIGGSYSTSSSGSFALAWPDGFHHPDTSVDLNGQFAGQLALPNGGSLSEIRLFRENGLGFLGAINDWDGNPFGCQWYGWR